MNWFQYYFQSTVVVCPYCQNASVLLKNDFRCKGEACGREIPLLFRKAPGHIAPILVPMIGWTNVGKTMSTFAMMLTLDRIVHLWPGFVHTYGSQETMEWMRTAVRELEETGELPGPTTEAIQPTYLLLLENLPYWKHLQNQARPLVVRDFSGELFRTMTIPPDQMRFLRDAPTLMMMFNLADLENNQATRDRFVLDELLHSYISTMQEQEGFDLKVTRRNLIIVLTQSDRLLTSKVLPANLARYLEDDPIARTLEGGVADPWTNERMATYLQAMDNASNEIGTWLTTYYASAATLVNRCKLNNIGLRFCLTSATGRPLKSQTNKLDAAPAPKRILDPLFCALQFEAEGHATWVPPVVPASAPTPMSELADIIFGCLDVTWQRTKIILPRMFLFPFVALLWILGGGFTSALAGGLSGIGGTLLIFGLPKLCMYGYSLFAGGEGRFGILITVLGNIIEILLAIPFGMIVYGLYSGFIAICLGAIAGCFSGLGMACSDLFAKNTIKVGDDCNYARLFGTIWYGIGGGTILAIVSLWFHWTNSNPIGFTGVIYALVFGSFCFAVLARIITPYCLPVDQTFYDKDPQSRYKLDPDPAPGMIFGCVAFGILTAIIFYNRERPILALCEGIEAVVGRPIFSRPINW